MDNNINCKNKKECEVIYLGHSGWAVKTENTLLIFDYTKVNHVIEDREVLNAVIDFEKIKYENLYVFVSHDHDDHYDKYIINWSDYIKNTKYIFGWRSEENNDFIQIGPNEDLKIDNIEVSTIKATDDGVGYLVKADGISILHMGDHANWVPQLDSIFKEEIDYIAEKCSDVDIIFVPIAKGGGGRPQSITDGAQYSINKLNVKAAFPMHGGGREFLYREFAEDVKGNINNSQVVCAEEPGNTWELSFGNENVLIRSID